MVRFEWTMIPAALILALCLPAAAPAMQVAAVDGRVEILRDHAGDWTPLVAGSEIEALDQVRTGIGATSRVRFLLPDGSVIVAGPESWVRLDDETFQADTSRVLVRLLGGEVRAVASDRFPESGRFEIETPTAVATVHGTEFIVAYDPDKAETEVLAVEGEVEVLGVLGVLGRPAVLQSGMTTVVRRGAFPESPTVLASDEVKSRRTKMMFAVSTQDTLLSDFSGVGSMPSRETTAPGRTAECPEEAGRMQRLQRQTVSLEGDVIDQPIAEFSVTRPGRVPPGSVRVNTP